MELTSKKRLINSYKCGKLPCFALGNVNWGNFASGALNAFGTTMRNAQYDGYTADDMMSQANTTTGYANGIGYDIYSPSIAYKNMVEEQRKKNAGTMFEMAGSYATAAGAINPWLAIPGAIAGFGVGAIMGNKKQQELSWQNRKFSQKLNNMNQFNQNGAVSLGVQLDNARKYGNQEYQSLWGYKDGKNSQQHGEIIEPVVSPQGVEFGVANSMVEPGEFGYRPSTGQLFEFSNGKNKKRQGDVLPANLTEEDVVFSDRKKNPEMPSLTFAESVPYYTNDMNRLIYLQALQKNKNLPGYKNSKEGYIETPTWLETFAPSALASLSALKQYLDIDSQPVYHPHTYRDNKMQNRALQTLEGLRINPNPIISEMRDSEFRTNKAIDVSSGLSASQRWKSKLRAMNATQNNIANLLGNIQQQNNALISDAQKTALSAGDNDRRLAISTKQQDDNVWLQGIGAKTKGKSQFIANLNDIYQNWAANNFKRKTMRGVLDMYQQKLDLDQMAIIAAMNNSTNTTPSLSTPKFVRGYDGNIYDRNGRIIGGAV